jgi:hypothetical protein
VRAERYRGALADLINALSAGELLQRFIDQLTDELPRCGDADLLRHMRWLLVQARMLQAEGLEHRAALDRAALDALLCDLFAVATWLGWPLPVSRDGDCELPLEPLPRGLLGADDCAQGVLVFQLPDDGGFALCRHRRADRVGDLSEHWRVCDHH